MSLICDRQPPGCQVQLTRKVGEPSPVRGQAMMLVTMNTTVAYIALGSNLGDRLALLDAAVARLRARPGIEVVSVSSYHETTPVGGPPNQGNYLNEAACIKTTLTAPQLLADLLAIENELGRLRNERFGPRTLDLDLLLFGEQILEIHEPNCDLIVPHPRMHQRLFVLKPLAEIGPLAVHPVLQSTVKDLLDRLSSPRFLVGQNAVVTGSTSGIGRAIALALAGASANVLIHGRRSTEAAEKVATECRAFHVESQLHLANLADEEECHRFVDIAWDWMKPHIWINKPGAHTFTGDAARR